LVALEPRALASLPEQYSLRWVGPLEARDRLAPILAQFIADAPASGDLFLRVHFFEDVSAYQAQVFLNAHAFAVVAAVPERHDYDIIVPFAQLDSLLNADAVQWMDFGPPEKIAQNECARWRTNVDPVQAAPYNLDGSGVDLGIWDGGKVYAHTDFSGRLTVVEPGAAVDDHATHVAGTMAGSGANSAAQGGEALQWRGMAPNADIFSYFWDFSVSDHNGAINTQGVDLSQNSWGYVVNSGNCSLYGNYSNDAPSYDDIITGLYGRRIPVVFAAGNERDDGDCGMSSAPPYLNYANIGPPGTGKNIITVGATNSNNDSMTSFSSWGPLDDGRIKPDVVAPGCESLVVQNYIKSTLSGNIYAGTGWCGTSMAAPVVSGISGLLIEQYRLTYGGDPQPATVKGLLIHTAADLDDSTSYYNPGPDYASGYGRVDAQAAVQAVIDQRLRQDALSHGQVDWFTIQAPPGASSVKVTLVWDDEPGTLNANPALVNNLDLWLVAPDGTTIHRPWILNPASPAANATRGTDSRNNVEQVMVPSPAAGTWDVKVQGTSVIPAGQSYSLIGGPFTPFTGLPAAFNKSDPANTASDLLNVQWLFWENSAGASSYEYCLDTTDDSDCDVAWTDIGSATSVQVADLLLNTTYHWQVRANNGGDAVFANSGAWWSFSTAALIYNLNLPVVTK
jgi:subtilisin family serine protease